MVTSAPDPVQYVSAGCNRTPHCMSWSRLSGLVYYGSHHSVCVYSVDKTRVITTLVGHMARVNCVRTAAIDSEVEYIVTGSTDCSVVVWRREGTEFTKVKTLEKHSGAVTNLAISVLDHVLIIVSTSTDNTIKLSKINLSKSTDEVFGEAVIELGTGLALDLHLATLPGVQNPLLVVAREDCKLHLYEVAGDILQKVGVLTGHEDWVVSLDSKVEGTGLIIVSGSQDSFVRMWRMDVAKAKEAGGELSVREEVMVVAGKEWGVSVESVLAGHEGRVYSVEWGAGGKQLLTASMDKTMLVWEEEEEGIWLEKVRVGETGGNTLGFLGAQWGQGGKQILGYSWGGAFHLWAESDVGWRAEVVGGGHQGGVVDISWEREGRYLLSVGKDQTARIHAHWAEGGVWQEVARPQVHGYDMSCCTMLSDHKYVSGAEEKVLRAFSAPSNFLDNLTRITGLAVPVSGARLAQGASTPSLGLSNKAVFEGAEETPVEEKHVKDQFPDNYFTAEVHSVPPPEETLVQNTLWPEEHKLYGHGYELFCCAASQDSRIVASACKSSDSSSARVILWDTKTWAEVGGISAHTLTVTQLAFSPCNTMLLCVSRDRTWSLHTLERVVEGEALSVTCSMVARTDKKTSVHTRLIWSCGWTSDSKYFVTASRDKKVVMWGKQEDKWGKVGEVLTLPDSVTAVAVSARICKEGYVVAAGLESGVVHVLYWDTRVWREVSVITGHHSTVTRLVFQPGVLKYVLASCSVDNSVRITNIEVDI